MRTLVARGFVNRSRGSYFLYATNGSSYLISFDQEILRELENFNQKFVQVKAQVKNHRINILTIKLLRYRESLGA